MTRYSAKYWHEQLQSEQVQASEIQRHYAQHTQKYEPRVLGFLSYFDPPELMESSSWSIPLALKDNIALKDKVLSCGSKMLANYISPFDAHVSEKLKQAGVNIVGKANMDEFAMGSSTENSAFQQTHNPWDLERVPGGSSGGSAALVAADLVPWSLGSSTGGSIRLPASFCGVVGMKPTYGRVSRYGLVAYASSLDQIGPLTANVEDNALLLNLIAGSDPRDSTSIQAQPNTDFTALLRNSIKDKVIGVPKEMMTEGVSPAIKEAVEKALAAYSEQGAKIVEVSLPTLPYALAAYYLIATSEASSNLARFDGVRYGHRSEQSGNLMDLYLNSRSEGFGHEVKLRIMLGTFALSSGYYDAYYLKAQKARALLIQDTHKAFEQCDVMMAPTAPVTAFKLGERLKDPLQMYSTDILTVMANLTGIPAMSLPCGLSEGLPVGLQIMGKPMAEAEVYQMAFAYEQATSWHTLTPQGLSV
jgi:aspartyl-tRNA(Asn)/glutamyl-tRNA(Gln) amidotransferase subunit A